jgi:hypothetical protein
MIQRLVIATIALFIATIPLQAQEQSSRWYVISSWEKGLNSHINDYLTPDNQGMTENKIGRASCRERVYRLV